MLNSDRAAKKAEELLPCLRPNDVCQPDDADFRKCWNCFHRVAVAAELREAYAEIERLKTMSTVEMMCENLNVKHHVEEWERRCLKAESEIARLRAALQKSAGFKVDRCACVFVDDEPTLECGYHQTLRAELASIEQFAESWPCHCGENYPGATMYHGQDCQTAVAVEFVAQWRAAKVKP